MFRKKTFIIVLSLFFLVSNAHASNLIFGAKSSTIQVGSGASFITESEISNVDGTIYKDPDATIEGAQITFANGSFVDGNNKMRMTGTLDPSSSNKIFLNGNKIFTGSAGSLHKKIEVSGKNNKIEGSTTIADDILLGDSTSTLSIDLVSNLKGNIYLNNGDLYVIENNLKFDDHKQIVGPGTVHINGNKLIFGAKTLAFNTDLHFIDAADIQFNDNVDLCACWTFSGASILEGNTNIMCLSEGGKIIVENNSSILLKNMVLHGVSNGSLFCMDNNSTITFQNVILYLDNDYTFSIGRFEILGSTRFSGDKKFIYNSNKQSLIRSKATLILDEGLTFSYDSGNMRKDLIAFEDSLAKMELDGATIHATVTGMQLTKGYLLVQRNSYLESEKTANIDEGITIGNDVADQDLYCEILKSTKLELRTGSLKYRNVLIDSISMENYMSELNINSGCNLYLYQSMDLGSGTMNYIGRGGLYNLPGKQLSGAFNVSGYLDYRTLSN